MTDTALPWLDDTLPEDSFQTVLAVVAHPDDMEYGAAAAVDRWTQAGKTVTYLLATHGEAGIDSMDPAECGPVRAQEERDSAAEVGVSTVEFLDHPDGTVEHGLPLRRDIARMIRTYRPEVVVTLNHRERFAGGGLNQADHMAVGRATVDAIRDAANRWVFPELVGEGLEPWTGVRALLVASSPDATHAVDVSGHLEAAVASLEAHQQYLEGLGEDYPSARDLLQGILGGAGERQGVAHAVTFEVLHP